MNLRNIIQSLFWGIITAGISLIFQLFVISIAITSKQSSEVDKIFLGSIPFLIIYAFSEEAFKYFIVIKKINPLSYGRGFLINAWIAGVGFALLEIFTIYQKNIYEKIDFQLLDLLKTAPLHILTFGTLGYYLAIWEKKRINAKIIFFNFIIHFTYNYSILYLDSYSYCITSTLVILLLIINIYSFIVVNKKLASD